MLQKSVNKKLFSYKETITVYVVRKIVGEKY